MDSLTKMMSVLDLITEASPSVSAESVSAALECSTSTSYRYLKTLCEAGILASQPGGSFVLGARIIEFDRQLRLSDPLMLNAAEPMREFSAALHVNMLLFSYHGESVICIDKAWADDSPASNYGRGRPMSLLRGAAGKVILAHLAPHKLRNLMLTRAHEIDEAGLGKDWQEFRDTLKKIRQTGFVVSRGEIDPGTIGIAAPIFDADDKVTGSLAVTVRESKPHEMSVEELGQRLIHLTITITAAISASQRGEQHDQQAS
jgi:DNA-binding IclR family transcriptional regulator